MISIVKSAVILPVEEKDVTVAPRLIDGLDIINALTPVSPKTGMRENLLSLARKLAADPQKAKLLEAAIQEIPSMRSDPRCTDEDLTETLMMRLQTGTPSENDAFRSGLMELIKSVPANQPSKSPVDDTKIIFDNQSSVLILMPYECCVDWCCCDWWSCFFGR